MRKRLSLVPEQGDAWESMEGEWDDPVFSAVSGDFLTGAWSMSPDPAVEPWLLQRLEIEPVPSSEVRQQRPRYVYFIKGGPFIKVGVSESPHTRLRELRTASPYALRLLGYYPGLYKNERELHDRLQWGRVHGEWFLKETPGLSREVERARAYMAAREQKREAA